MRMMNRTVRIVWMFVLCCGMLFCVASAMASPSAADLQNGRMVVAALELSSLELAGDTPIYLLGLAEQADETRSILSLQLVRGAQGFFGSFWELQLHGDEHIVSEPITLFDTRTYNWEGSYTVALGYDERDGTAIVVVVPENSDDPLVYERFVLPAFDWSDLPRQFAGGEARFARPSSFHIQHEYTHVVPFGVPWSWQQLTWDEHDAFSAYHIHRQHPVVFQVNSDEDDWPGTFAVRVYDAEKQHNSFGYDVAGTSRAEVMLSDVPAGVYNVTLEYTDADHTVLLASREMIVGAVQVRWSDWQLTRQDDVLHIAGVLHLIGDGKVPLDSVTVTADFVPHRPIHVQENNNIPWGESLYELHTEHAVQFDEGHATVPFSFTFPLSEEISEENAMFEARLQVRSDDNVFFPTDTTTSAWYAPPPPEQSWKGFLHNETVEHTPVVAGVDLYTLTGEIDEGPIHMYVTVIDVTNPNISVDTLIPYYPNWNSSQWPRATVSDMAERANALVAMNASYFEIQTTMTPRGAAIRGGELLKSALPEWETLIGFTDTGVPYVGEWKFTGGVQRSDGTAFRRASGLNTTQRYPDQLALYAAPPSMTTPGMRSGFNNVVELVIGDITQLPDDEHSTRRILRGEVKEVRKQQEGVKLEEGIVVVTGYGQSAEYLLETYSVGDEVDIVQSFQGETAWPPLTDWRQFYSAVPTGVVLLQNGSFGTPGIRADTERSPRTAIGVTADQNTMFWVSVEGRSARSIGLTYRELATFFSQLGAFHAVNLDGGGSATLVLRDDETGRHRVVNNPSDGTQRLVPDGIAIMYKEKEE